jgi:hypothetical protein
LVLGHGFVKEAGTNAQDNSENSIVDSMPDNILQNKPINELSSVNAFNNRPTSSQQETTYTVKTNGTTSKISQKKISVFQNK